jgi:hypothetical protein
MLSVNINNIIKYPKNSFRKLSFYTSTELKNYGCGYTLFWKQDPDPH